MNGVEADYQSLGDAELRGRRKQFMKRVREATDPLRGAFEEVQKQAVAADSEEREEIKSRVEEADKELRKAEVQVLEELIPEAFAAVRESSRRTIGLRHFDVQLIGGVVLHEGYIVEMNVDEGKDLVARLHFYSNKL